MVAAEFLCRSLNKMPSKGYAVLTDNGGQFTPQAHPFLPGGHCFDRICWEYNGEHRLTKPAHLWTNGRVEHMNRTIKKATIQRFPDQTTQELNEHLPTFLLAYNYAKLLKTTYDFTPPYKFTLTRSSTYPFPNSIG